MLTMSRREVLAMAAMGALLRRNAGAQQGAPSIMYRDYSRCLPGLFARPGREGLSVAEPRDLKSDHAGSHPRKAAVGHRNFLDPCGRDAGAYSPERPNGGHV